jgi:hypothetical protein
MLRSQSVEPLPNVAAAAFAMNIAPLTTRQASRTGMLDHRNAVNAPRNDERAQLSELRQHRRHQCRHDEGLRSCSDVDCQGGRAKHGARHKEAQDLSVAIASNQVARIVEQAKGKLSRTVRSDSHRRDTKQT